MVSAFEMTCPLVVQKTRISGNKTYIKKENRFQLHGGKICVWDFFFFWFGAEILIGTVANVALEDL